MSLFTNPEDLARESAQWIRRQPALSRETTVLLEQAATREVRQLRILRQIVFLVVVVPLVLALLAALVVGAGLAPLP